MEAEMNINNLKRKRPEASENDEDLIAAEFLYKLANSRVLLVEDDPTPLSYNMDDAIKLANGAILLSENLPAPPLHLMRAHDFHARFNNISKLNQHTIEPSCDEIRMHFRREEAIRYSIPESSFSYTALDGRESWVPSLKKSDKPLTKSKKHYIFKGDRPPYITLCSLVTDAAARLPGGIGTKVDICTLVRDSQYVVEDISDEAIKQVVTGALNRMGLELDPCVKFKAGLWTYSYGGREERESGVDDTREQ